MEKVRPWCGQPSHRGRLRNRTEHCYSSGAAHWHLLLQLLQQLQRWHVQCSHLTAFAHASRFDSWLSSSSQSATLNARSIVTRIHCCPSFIVFRTSWSGPATDEGYQMACAGKPFLPHRPTSCQNTSRDCTLPECMTLLTSLISTPMPKAIVQTNSLIIESGWRKCCSKCCCRSGETCAWYIEIMHMSLLTEPPT